MHHARYIHVLFLTITLFNVNVDADVNNLRRVSIAEQVNVRGYKLNSFGEINLMVLKHTPLES